MGQRFLKERVGDEMRFLIFLRGWARRGGGEANQEFS